MMQDSVNGAVCRTLLVTLARLASRGQLQSLKSVGMTSDDIDRVSRLSIHDIDELTDASCHRLDLTEMVRSLMKEPVPDEFREYFEYGISNEMMRYYFRVSNAQCCDWRGDLTVAAPYNGRSVPEDVEPFISPELLRIRKERVENSNRQYEVEQMLKLAKEHKVSLRAIWSELKKWEKEDEKK